MPGKQVAHPVDIHVGAAIRARRKELGITQPELGEMLGGLSFQQIQKYERSGNRISASRLFEVSQALKVPIAYFFAGLEGDQTTAYTREIEASIADLLRSPEGQEMLKAFPKLEGATLRKQLVELVKVMIAPKD